MSLRRPCSKVGCGVLVEPGRGSRCPQHQVEGHRATAERRGTAHERGYGARWRRIAARIRERDPLCRACCATAARASELVDHIIPRQMFRWRWDAQAARPSAAEVAYVAALYGRTLREVSEQLETADPDDEGNLAGMCRVCHDRKTRAEQGRFGGDAR